MQRPHLLPFLAVLTLLCGTALAQDINPQPMTGGVQDFIEFTQIIPKMDKLLGNVFTIMRYMDLPGVADTIARIIGGGIALTTFFIAWFNYGFNKRVSFLGMDGSFNNMVWAAITVMLISTGVPRIVGEAGWAVWRVTYTSVEARVHPKMDEMIQKRTKALAEQVWAYGATGLSAGFAPIMTAGQFLKGDLDVSKDSVAGEAERETTTAQVNAAESENKKFAAIWQLGSLLIAGMFMAYIGVIFGSGLFVIFAATFMPVAFAMLPINAGLMWKQIGGMVSSILVAGAAPGLMLVNVMVVFDGPIDYLTTMMKNQNIAAVDNAKFTADMIKTCTGKVTEGNLAQKITAGVTDAIKPLNDVLEKFCVVQTSGVQTLYTLGQATVFMIVGLAVAAMLFIGLSGLSMMIFREFKGRVDDLFSAGGTVGNGSSGAATKAISAMGNRVAGAAIGAAGVMTGNAQLASAGARSVVSGNNALSGAAASMIERGRDNKTTQQRDAKQGQQQAAARQERQQENAEREAAGDKKYESRQAASKAERQQEQTANRAYSEGLYETRQQAAKTEREARETERKGGMERGEGSQTDPRSAYSGGENAGKEQGGAESYSTADGRPTTPARGQQGSPSQQGGSSGAGANTGTTAGSTAPNTAGQSAASGPATEGSTVPQSAGTSAAQGGAGSTLPSASSASAGAAPTSLPQRESQAGQSSAGAPRDDVRSSAATSATAGRSGPETTLPSGPRDDVSSAPVTSAQSVTTSASEGQSASAVAPEVAPETAPTSETTAAPTGPAEGVSTAPVTTAAVAPNVPAFDPNSRQAAQEQGQSNAPSQAATTSAAAPQTPPANTGISAPQQAAVSAPSAPVEQASAGSSAPSAPLPAAYTSEGNAALKRNGVSPEERDQAAVLDYHRMLNKSSEDQARTYISKDQAAWDLERRGMLPSQRDANAQKVQEYAQTNGINEREAERALTESRQLVQHERPTPPKPITYASEAEERAAQGGQTS